MNVFINLFRVIVLLVLFSSGTFAQVNSTISPSAIEEAWTNMSNMVIGTAEAMSAEHYTYTPHSDLRNFAQQIGHTTNANYLFASVVKLERPNPSPVSDTSKKEQVIKELKDSFNFIADGIKTLKPEDLNEEIEFFGRKMSRLQAILIMTSHLQREHGKTITYVRIKGIAPARSAGW